MKNRTVNKQKLKRTQASLAVRRAVQDHVVDIAHQNMRRRSTDKKHPDVTLGSLSNGRVTKGAAVYPRPVPVATKRSFWTRLKDRFMGLFGKGKH